MHRPVPTIHRLLAVVVVAAFVLGACSGDDGAESSATTAATTPEATEPVDDETTTPSGDPTGRLTLDGETWELTYDAEDPNASCQILVGNTAVVSGMRTPEGNRVDVTVQDIPRDNATATYYSDDEIPAWSAWTGESSEAPEWSIDGTTVSLSGRWINRLDPTQPEVDGDLEVTC
jgi:hypothetical protein